MGILLAAGFLLHRHDGTSHRRYRGVINGEIRYADVAVHNLNDDIPIGTLQSIIRQSGYPKICFENSFNRTGIRTLAFTPRHPVLAARQSQHPISGAPEAAHRRSAGSARITATCQTSGRAVAPCHRPCCAGHGEFASPAWMAGLSVGSKLIVMLATRRAFTRYVKHKSLTPVSAPWRAIRPSGFA